MKMGVILTPGVVKGQPAALPQPRWAPLGRIGASDALPRLFGAAAPSAVAGPVTPPRRNFFRISFATRWSTRSASARALARAHGMISVLFLHDRRRMCD